MSPGPPPTHSDELGQLIPSSTTVVACQAAAPPPGSVLVTTPPVLVVTHSTGAAVTHDTPVLNPDFAIDPRCMCQPGNPPAGRAEVRTAPSLSTATQSVALTQDIPEM